MGGVERRLRELGHELPPAIAWPPGVEVRFRWARVRDDRCVVSGHGALDRDGLPQRPFGRVPDQVSLVDAQHSAVSALLALLGTVRRAIGDLDRIDAWISVDGFVQAGPDYGQVGSVLDPVSELLVEVFGDAGAHARTVIGVTALPLNQPVLIAAECAIAAPEGGSATFDPTLGPPAGPTGGSPRRTDV